MINRVIINVAALAISFGLIAMIVAIVATALD
jgi:hypothetical protein